MSAVARLNHAVLYVADAKRSAAFYADVLGFEVVHEMPGAAFLRAEGSRNDHDLGLFSVGAGAGDAAGAKERRPGLYHLAWQVDTIDDLVALRDRLSARGSLVGMSDHGVSKSLYGADPDGIEFEVMWAVPRADWPETVMTRQLDLPRELARWAGTRTLAQAGERA